MRDTWSEAFLFFPSPSLSLSQSSQFHYLSLNLFVSLLTSFSFSLSLPFFSLSVSLVLSLCPIYLLSYSFFSPPHLLRMANVQQDARLGKKSCHWVRSRRTIKRSPGIEDQKELYSGLMNNISFVLLPCKTSRNMQIQHFINRLLVFLLKIIFSQRQHPSLKSSANAGREEEARQQGEKLNRFGNDTHFKYYPKKYNSSSRLNRGQDSF